MKNCIRCGKSFFGRRRIRLKDSEICGKCFRELGFDRSYDRLSDIYAYDDIKDGIDAYNDLFWKRKAVDASTSSFSVTMTGAQERDLVCTEEEREIFEAIRSVLADRGADLSLFRLVRVSDNYLTIKYGDWDLARIKYTTGAKWIQLPVLEASTERHYIESPDDVYMYADLLGNSIAHIEKYD